MPPPGRRGSGTWSRNPLVITAVLLSSLIVDSLPGYLFGFVGLFLLWRSKTFGLFSRVGLTLLALLSRELFRFFSPPASPNPLFRFEPGTIATSSSLWGQLIVVWAFGILLLISFRKMRPQAGPERGEGRRGPAVALIAGVVMAGVIGVVTYRFLGPGRSMHSSSQRRGRSNSRRRKVPFFFEKSEEPGGKNIRLHFELDHTPYGRGRFAPGGLLEIDGQRYQRKGI